MAVPALPVVHIAWMHPSALEDMLSEVIGRVLRFSARQDRATLQSVNSRRSVSRAWLMTCRQLVAAA